MFRTAPPPAVSLATALSLAAALSLKAEAAMSAEPQVLSALPLALLSFSKGSAVAFFTTLAIGAVLMHRTIVSHAHALAVRISIRASALRPLPAAPNGPLEPLAPAKHLPQGADLAEVVKQRMTEVHRHLRRLAPELLPVFADCRAAQVRLLHETRARTESRIEAETLLIGALVQIETATRKLSLVLPDATKEHALGNYADTLEKVTGEALDCLIALRARAKAGQRGMQIGGEAGSA